MKNMEFSRSFFKMMTTNGKGLTLKDLAEWLISLGLALDNNFVQKIMKTLAPAKFKSSFFNFEDIEINIREFASLFKVDPPNKKMAMAIKRACDEENKEKVIQK